MTKTVRILIGASTIISGTYARISWYICRRDALGKFMTGESLSQLFFVSEKIRSRCERVPDEPGTITSMMLDLKKVKFQDPYYGVNLRYFYDMHDSGHSYYTYWYVGGFNVDMTTEMGKKHRLVFRGINYRPNFFFNGALTRPFGDSETQTGMFRRYSIDLTKLLRRSVSNDSTIAFANTVAVLVHPPDFPGDVRDGGQGGDHSIARNGAVSQFSAGWDWIQATPDRHTGLWDKVYFEVSGVVSIRDCYIRTDDIDYISSSAQLSLHCFLEHAFPDGPRADHEVISGVLEMSLLDEVGHVVCMKSERVQWQQQQSYSVFMHLPTLHAAKLWWPHTHGQAHLYTARVAFFSPASITSSSTSVATFQDASLWTESSCGSRESCLVLSHELSHTALHSEKSPFRLSSEQEFRVGVRVVKRYIHDGTGGWAFSVNGRPIFLCGGNWIATDQLLRYSKGDLLSQQRYLHEVALHKAAGLNLIRVWGGGIAERPEFYAACDALGVLVYQEFWMTGDNNGRWGGSSDWPEDPRAYLANVRDTILLLRVHASLVLWGGGNELHPRGRSPRPDVADGIAALLEELDPLRAYFPSSMSPQSPDPALYDHTYALSPQDGPYGLLSPSRFYNERNPGLGFNYSSVFISVQPEVGSVSTPVLRSLRRFLPTSSLKQERVPSRNAGEKDVDEAWKFHKYISYVSDGDCDQIYSYTESNSTLSLSAHEYSMRAQLVQYEQYRAMFEGFLLHQWTRYAGVMLWKSQSPWPTLRGALYDYYLDGTGGLWGAQKGSGADAFTSCVDAHGRPIALQVILNPATLLVSVVNRVHTVKVNVTVVAEVRSLRGALLQRRQWTLPRVGPDEVVTVPDLISYPGATSEGSVYLYRVWIDVSCRHVAYLDSGLVPYYSPNTYWQGDPKALCQDRAELAVLRSAALKRSSYAIIETSYPYSASPFTVHTVGFAAWGAHTSRNESDALGAVSRCLALLHRYNASVPGVSLSSFTPAVPYDSINDFSYDQWLLTETVCGVVVLSNVPAIGDVREAILAVRLTLLRACDGEEDEVDEEAAIKDCRVLPTFYSSNYISLLPSERVAVAFFASSSFVYSDSSPRQRGQQGNPVDSAYSLEVEGWNVASFTHILQVTNT